jgi:type I site-specific restriction endonuclease
MAGPTEAKKGNDLIDPAPKRAGWDVDHPAQVGIEIPVDGFDLAAWSHLHKRLKERGGTYSIKILAGISDYVLKQDNGQIVAVVEAGMNKA